MLVSGHPSPLLPCLSDLAQRGRGPVDLAIRGVVSGSDTVLHMGSRQARSSRPADVLDIVLAFVG